MEIIDAIHLKDMMEENIEKFINAQMQYYQNKTSLAPLAIEVIMLESENGSPRVSSVDIDIIL